MIDLERTLRDKEADFDRRQAALENSIAEALEQRDAAISQAEETAQQLSAERQRASAAEESLASLEQLRVEKGGLLNL
jgi:hypothetical protein